MKKILYSVFVLFTFALLLGGSCGGGQEAPVTDLPDVTEPTAPEPDTQEPETPVTPPPAQLDAKDLQKVYFDFDKSNIRPDGRVALEHNAQLLNQFSEATIMIEGHCDERGTVEYNLALGERRAESVKRYLINLGINESRMETISYGKERPVDLGHNEVAWQKNRRAEFRTQ